MAARDILKLMNADEAAGNGSTDVRESRESRESRDRVAPFASVPRTSAPLSSAPFSLVQPKPILSTDLSREVRIALDGLTTRGLTNPRRARHSHAAGMAPFICG